MNDRPHPWYLDGAYAVAGPLNARINERAQARLRSAAVDFGQLAVLQTAQSVAPAPVGSDLLAARSPYTSDARIAELVAADVAAGLLAAAPGGGHHLTDAGRAVVDGIAEDVRAGVADVAPRAGALAPERLERLDALLARQVDACAAVDGHAVTCLAGSRAFDPGPDAPVLERIRRRLNDLFAFRDDAHIAAWRPLGVAGHAWEAFSHVWGEKVWGDAAATPEALADKLGAFRGYDAEGYRAALRAMAERGWVEEAGGAFRVTEAGRAAREAAEAQTDRLYFAPWRLSEPEAAELRGLLEALADALSAAAEPAGA